MNETLVIVAGVSYKVSTRLAMEEAQAGEYVLCLDEVRDNALPRNKHRQVPIVYQWDTGNDCNGCRKIIESNDPKLIRKGVRKLEISK